MATQRDPIEPTTEELTTEELTQEDISRAKSLIELRISMCKFLVTTYCNNNIEIPTHLDYDYPDRKRKTTTPETEDPNQLASDDIHWYQNNSYRKFPSLEQLENEELKERRFFNFKEGYQFMYTGFGKPELQKLWAQTAKDHFDFFYELTKRAKILEEESKASRENIVGITMFLSGQPEIRELLTKYSEAKSRLESSFSDLYIVFYALMRRSKINELIEERLGGMEVSEEELAEIESEVDQFLAEIAR